MAAGKAHRSRAATRDVSARPAPLDELRRPHLVLADVGDDAISAATIERGIQGCIDIVRHQLRCIRSAQIRLPVLVRGLCVADVPEPDRGITRRDLIEQRAQSSASVPDDRHGDLHVLPDLRRIDVDVNHLRAGRKG
jgi:hypothetical protein